MHDPNESNSPVLNRSYGNGILCFYHLDKIYTVGVISGALKINTTDEPFELDSDYFELDSNYMAGAYQNTIRRYNRKILSISFVIKTNGFDEVIPILRNYRPTLYFIINSDAMNVIKFGGYFGTGITTYYSYVDEEGINIDKTIASEFDADDLFIDYNQAMDELAIRMGESVKDELIGIVEKSAENELTDENEFTDVIAKPNKKKRKLMF